MNTKTKFNLQYLRTIIIGIIIIIISTTTAFSGDFSVTKWKKLSGYSDPISDVQFSPLGNYFSLISGDTVELYDKNWNKIWEDADSSNFAWALAFSPDEKYIVFRRYKSNILRLSDKQIIQTLEHVGGNNPAINLECDSLSFQCKRRALHFIIAEGLPPRCSRVFRFGW